MNKVLRIGKTKTYGGRSYSVFVNVKWELGRLSITGVEGPLPSGNCLGGCGQIDLRKIDFTSYAPGFAPDIVETLAAIWDRYHLNDLTAGCEHQRALGWDYDKYPLSNHNCPICGYSCGSKWLTEEVPQWAIYWLFALPDSDVNPAWV